MKDNKRMKRFADLLGTLGGVESLPSATDSHGEESGEYEGFLSTSANFLLFRPFIVLLGWSSVRQKTHESPKNHHPTMT